MLQIISGKFFEGDSLYVSDCKSILYSNFYWILPIETCIATLEPVDIFNTSSISPYVINYKNQIEKSEGAGVVRTGDSEIVNQFKLLCIFGFKAFFDNDRSSVELLCRKHPKSSTENLVPSTFVPRFFDYHIDGKNEEIERFIQFINKVIGLPREKYLAVINSINAFSQALQTLNYNLDLAYSLMIYSLESLSQKFDEFKPIWDDYDQSVKDKLNELFDKTDLSHDTIISIQNILLRSSNLKTTGRFIDFTSKYVSDSFFKEEANGLKNPLRKSELKQALKNAYKMRSNYVHELKELEKSLKFPQIIDGGESIHWKNQPYLTFAGLTRLTHHIIYNFIQKQDYLKKERYNWRQDLPNTIQMKIHPKHWIWDEKIFTPSDTNITFSGFLTLLIDKMFHDEKLIDLRSLMLKIEKFINGGLSDRYKIPMISLYYLYNNLMSADFRSPNYDMFIKDHIKLIFRCNIENMVTILLLNKKWPWDIEESRDHYVKYKVGKFNKDSLNIPHFFELCIIVEIANRFLEKGDVQEFKKWLDIAILEIPGKSECQRILEKYKSEEEMIILKDTLLECMKE